MSSGIYQIRNIVNGKRYIGSAVDLHRRWIQHYNRAKRGIHHSAHFQAAWDKYGPDSFIFEILLEFRKEEILDHEQDIINRESPEYNIARNVTAPMTGRNHDEKAKELISASKRGKKRPPEVVMKMSERMKGKLSWNKGKKMSPEICAINSAAHKGKTLSEEHRRHISEGGKGRKQSAEWVAAHSERMRGNKNWLGKKHTDEFKAKIVERLTKHHEHNGEIHTSEEWAKIFNISTKAFARRLRIWGNVDRIYVPRMQ